MMVIDCRSKIKNSHTVFEHVPHLVHLPKCFCQFTRVVLFNTCSLFSSLSNQPFVCHHLQHSSFHHYNCNNCNLSIFAILSPFAIIKRVMFHQNEAFTATTDSVITAAKLPHRSIINRIDISCLRLQYPICPIFSTMPFQFEKHKPPLPKPGNGQYDCQFSIWQHYQSDQRLFSNSNCMDPSQRE